MTNLIFSAYLLAWNFSLQNLPGAEFFGGLPTTIFRWTTVACGVFFLARQLIAKQNQAPSPLALLILLLISFATVVAAQDRIFSFVEFLRYASILGIGILTFQQIKPNDALNAIERTFFVLASASILEAILLEGLSPKDLLLAPLYGERIRFSGFSIHPNNLGFMGASIIVTAMFNATYSYMAKRCMVGGVGLLAVILSGSRSSLLAMALVLGAQALIKGLSQSNLFPSDKVGWQRLISATFISFSIAIAAPLVKLNQLDEVLQGGATEADQFDASDYARTEMWGNAVSAFRSHPITGVGFGSKILEMYNPIDKDYQYAVYAHNALLNALQSGGILLAICLLAAIYFIARAYCIALYVANCDRARSRPERNQAGASSALILVGIVASAVDGCMQGNFGMTIILAAAVAIPCSLIQPRTLNSAVNHAY